MKKRSALVNILVVVLIALLATALRLYRMDAQSLWYDEGFSVYLARMDLTSITQRTAADIQPPFYYCLLHFWMRLFGQSETALRALSVLFGVLAVPLAYAVAWRLFRDRAAGWLAALLIAASPLHLWYGQEVRMYTLLTFQGLLSGYLLLALVERSASRPAGEGGALARDALVWAAYALTAIAALYTHYFAFFVLAFQGIYLLVAWGLRGFRPARLIGGGLAAGAVTMLAYVPWLPNVLTRYGADASYWPGQLKLHEVLVDIALSWVGGESVSEQIGIFLALGMGLVLVLCLLTLTRRGGDRRQAARSAARQPSSPAQEPARAQWPLAFLLLYLLLPPALILLLSYDAPKFSARYVMVSQPALLLLLAGGLPALWKRGGRLLARLARRALAVAALAFLLGSAGYADYQAYESPGFARADFRGAAAYVREHRAADEAVILCSGHAFAVFDLYAPDLERHLLPDSPTLDVSRSLDYSIAESLNRWLGGKSGVWLVLWQEEVVDPVGYLPAMLDQAGDEQPVGARFSQVRVQHYHLPEAVYFSAEPPIEHPVGLNFGNRLLLVGYSQSGPQQVKLFWKALRPLVEDYAVSLLIRDTNSQVWGSWDGRPGAYLYPTSRWRPGQLVFGRHELVPFSGTPPGDYGLEVGVYTEADPIELDLLDAAGASQGKRAMLGAVQLSVPAAPADAIEVANELEADAGAGLSLRGWDLSRSEAQPGDRLLLTLVWSVEQQPADDYLVRLLVTDAGGQVLDTGRYPPTNAWHPTSMWQAGQAWRGQTTFRLPIQASPGTAGLAAQLVGPGDAPAGPLVELGEIEVLPTDRTFVAPVPAVRREADFGKMALLGAGLAPGTVPRGGVLRVTLYWRAQADMDVAYTVFVHLLGPDGKVAAGRDLQPVGGARPTTGWVPGEYITDPHDISIPSDLAPGDYVVEVGWYDAGAPNLPRLAVLDEEGRAETDRVIFGPVTVK